MRTGKIMLQAAVAGAALLLAAGASAGGGATQSAPGHAPYRFESHGQARIDGRRLEYRALVEETFVTDPGGQKIASIVSTNYFLEDGQKGGQRPVLFVFNGGPGSAGLWLQMGLAGPRRVDFEDAVKPRTVPPFHLADNAESLLDVADIVIFDPPGTGYSRVLPAGKAEDFYGVKQDAAVTLEFIRGWLQRHDRFNSPRFLLGESYGTVRAAVVAKLMPGGPFGSGHMDAITLNGVILLGEAIGHADGDIALANTLPSLAAAAWYHGKVDRQGKTLAQQFDAARAFAANEYIQALYAGSDLDEKTRQAVARRLAELTGLPLELVLAENLRITADIFAAHLLQGTGRQVGKYDARFTLPLAADGGDPVADDPAMAQYVPAFVAAVNLHLRDELGVTLPEPYLAIEFHRVNGRWDWGHGPGVPSRGDYAGDLAVAMRRNPALRLFVGSGYYDLVTTAGAAEYMVTHNDLPAGRVTLRNYESGHMAYLGDQSRKKLAADLRRFITAAVRQ